MHNFLKFIFCCCFPFFDYNNEKDTHQKQDEELNTEDVSQDKKNLRVDRSVELEKKLIEQGKLEENSLEEQVVVTPSKLTNSNEEKNDPYYWIDRVSSEEDYDGWVLVEKK